MVLLNFTESSRQYESERLRYWMLFATAQAASGGSQIMLGRKDPQGKDVFKTRSCPTVDFA